MSVKRSNSQTYKPQTINFSTGHKVFVGASTIGSNKSYHYQLELLLVDLNQSTLFHKYSTLQYESIT